MSKRRRIGGYVGVRALGAEGFTDLFSANDPATDEPVLLRVCQASEPEMAGRFRAEADRAAELRHEHIAPILKVGSRNGTVFVAEPASRDGDLAALLEQGALPAPTARLALLRQVAAALAHAHTHGLLHRDLKPSSVQILPDGKARVSGFGTGKLLSAHARLNAGDHALPEAGYLAPELIEGRPPDGRSDVFGFGLLAYELLTTQRAFPAATLTGLYRQLVGCDPVSIGELWTECPPQVEALVARCLRRDPEARFDDFAGVLEALDQALEDIASRDEASKSPARAEDIDHRTTITMATPPGEPAETAAPPAEGTGAADAPTVELTVGADKATEPLGAEASAEPTTGELPREAEATAPSEADQAPPPDRDAAARPAPDSAPAAGQPGETEAAARVFNPQQAAALLERGLARLRRVPRRGWLGAAGALLGLLAVVVVVSLLRGPSTPEPAGDSGGTDTEITPPAVTVPMGRLVLDATPWGEVTRLLDAGGSELPLPAERRTPLVLDLEPGSYEAFLSSPRTEKESACSVEVAADSTANCLIDAGKLTVNDYFKNLGWWR